MRLTTIRLMLSDDMIYDKMRLPSKKTTHSWLEDDRVFMESNASNKYLAKPSQKSYRTYYLSLFRWVFLGILHFMIPTLYYLYL